MNASNTTPTRRRKLPAKYAGVVMPLLLSLFMTCIVSAISTAKNVGVDARFFSQWPGAWLLSWIVAFPVLLLVQPAVRRITLLLVEPA